MSSALSRSSYSWGKGLVALGSLLSLAVLTAPAQAQVTVTTTAFNGTFTESFESFPNYQSTMGVPISPIANPTFLFGGAATLTGTNNVVYEPSAGAIFSLGDNGTAQVVSGTKALGLNNAAYTATLTFNTALTQFGGYFNATRTSTLTDLVTFTFYDAANTVIDTKSLDVNPNNTTTGALNFYGFTSPTAFQSVAITGNYVVLDSLRATTAQSATPLPEPGALALTATALSTVLLRRRVRSR